MERLDDGMFSGLYQLRRLDLDKNMIQEIRNNTFSHLRKLEILHMSDNALFTIYGQTFHGLMNLRVLHLDKTGTGMGILREFTEFRGIFLKFALIRIHILIDLLLSFPQNFEFLFYDQY